MASRSLWRGWEIFACLTLLRHSLGLITSWIYSDSLVRPPNTEEESQRDLDTEEEDIVEIDNIPGSNNAVEDMKVKVLQQSSWHKVGIIDQEDIVDILDTNITVKDMQVQEILKSTWYTSGCKWEREG